MILTAKHCVGKPLLTKIEIRYTKTAYNEVYQSIGKVSGFLVIAVPEDVNLGYIPPDAGFTFEYKERHRESLTVKVSKHPDLAIIKLQKNDWFLGFSNFIDLRDSSNIITEPRHLAGPHKRIFQTGYLSTVESGISSKKTTHYASSTDTDQVVVEVSSYSDIFIAALLQPPYVVVRGDSGGPIIACDLLCNTKAGMASPIQRYLCRLAGISSVVSPYDKYKVMIAAFTTPVVQKFIKFAYEQQLPPPPPPDPRLEVAKDIAKIIGPAAAGVIATDESKTQATQAIEL